MNNIERAINDWVMGLDLKNIRETDVELLHMLRNALTHQSIRRFLEDSRKEIP